MLSSEKIDPVFAPEVFTDHGRQAFYHGMLGLTAQTLPLLRQQLSTLPAEVQEDVRKMIEKRIRSGDSPGRSPSAKFRPRGSACTTI